MDSPHRHFLEPNVVPHPGETVLEYLEFNGWSQRDLARRTGLTPKTISDICNGKGPITPPTALAFEKALQRPAHLWLNLQLCFDEAKARGHQAAKSAEWNDWLRKFPLEDMRRMRFSLAERGSDVDILLNFFGVSSPESWSSVWNATGVAYRQTRTSKTHGESVAAWIRETEIVASRLPVAEFDQGRLASSLGQLRLLTRIGSNEIMDPLQEICATAGVAVVLVPALPRTGISGCARWLTERKALVGLTLRYKTDDQFWFTVFHELGHLLLHRNKRLFVVDNADKDLLDRVVDPEMRKYESEASRFASDTLIPPKELGEFIRKGLFANESVHDFAEQIGVGPGIVIGRLQFEGILAPYQGNKLKQKLNWDFV